MQSQKQNSFLTFVLLAFVLLGGFITYKIHADPTIATRMLPMLVVLDIGYLMLALGFISGELVSRQWKQGALKVIFVLFAVCGIAPVVILRVPALAGHIAHIVPLLAALAFGYAVVMLWLRIGFFELREGR